MITTLYNFVDSVKFFDSGHTLEQVAAALFWIGGGAGSACALCAWGLVIRATKGASGDTSL